MENVKQTSLYLEDTQLKYLALMSVLTELNKSQLLRDMIDNDMQANEGICKEFEKILY